MKKVNLPFIAELKEDMEGVFRKYGDRMTALEMLAVASQVVGMMIAFQNHEKFEEHEIMELVMANIKHGNSAALLRHSRIAGSA